MSNLLLLKRKSEGPLS